MNPYITFRMELGRLLDSTHGGNFGQHLLQEAAFMQKFKGHAGVTFSEHLGQLNTNSFATDLVNFRGQVFYGVERGGMNAVSEARREPYRTQHAKLVLANPVLRLANGANDAGANVGLSTDEIQHFIFGGIKQQAID